VLATATAPEKKVSQFLKVGSDTKVPIDVVQNETSLIKSQSDSVNDREVDSLKGSEDSP